MSPIKFSVVRGKGETFRYKLLFIVGLRSGVQITNEEDASN